MCCWAIAPGLTHLTQFKAAKSGRAMKGEKVKRKVGANGR